MKDDPFDKYPPGFRPLLDKLPEPDENGNTALAGHWWHKDRDSIALAIAKLGREMQHIQTNLNKARAADDLDAVRKGIGTTLIKIQDALMPIYGADLIWPINMAIETLECAARGKRHSLTALRHEEVHILRDMPKRLVRQAFAAAALDFFFEELANPNQGQLAESIAEAMGKGGFRVRSDGVRKPPSGRTVHDWRTAYLPGKRHGRRSVSPEAKEAFEELRQQLAAGQGSIPLEEYFDRVLANITDACKAVF